ncbi:MAG: polymerase chi subunit, HolC [Proteobacteria bacterium]|nr:polymerase chi subunit, HolC [Pseudomonadota bacterium]RPJ45971.1 MAG: DNA polymerase III subunit chi [Betaproteobacteria bacterium]
MTQIDFYTAAEDRLHTACRLAAKARSHGLRVTLFCPDREIAARLDRMLWAVPATGFLPHCAPDDRLAPVTPVLIDTAGDTHLHDEMLINLHTEWPAFFSRYQRLAEIVSGDDADRAQARGRYKFYRDRGYAIRTHDLSGTSA